MNNLHYLGYALLLFGLIFSHPELIYISITFGSIGLLLVIIGCYKNYMSNKK